MVTPLLPPSVSSVMSTAAASVASKFRDSGARHFPLPSPSLSPSLLPPPQKSLVCRMVVASMPPPLVLWTLPSLLNAHRGSIASCPWAPLFPFASCLQAGCCIACCRVPPPRAEILGDPYSKKSPLPSIGTSPRLATSPKDTSYRVLGQSRIHHRHNIRNNHTRILAQ